VTDTFAGRPIEGDIQHYVEPTEQRDPQEFIDSLEKLLATPGVEAVRWNQYTPYFNDGEPCVFNIYSAYIKIEGDDDYEDGDYGDGYRSTYDLYDYDVSKGSDYDSRRVFNPIGGFDSKVLHEALSDFESTLSSGYHNTILGKKFGDPATVTATKDGFSVEFYDHE